MPIKIEGLEVFLGKFSERQLDQARREVSKELYQRGEKILSASQAVVPVDTGALMSSGQVTLPTEDGRGVVEVTVGYGDETADYALYVHEELASPSGGPINWTRPGSGPKYLENPAMEQAHLLPEDVKRGLLRAFGPDGRY